MAQHREMEAVTPNASCTYGPGWLWSFPVTLTNLLDLFQAQTQTQALKNKLALVNLDQSATRDPETTYCRLFSYEEAQ